MSGGLQKSEDSVRVAGPELPPHLKDEIGPSFPQAVAGPIGPSLPPHLMKDQHNEDVIIGPAMPSQIDNPESDSLDEDSIGPKVPFQLKNKGNTPNKSSVIGPCLPPHLTPKTLQSTGPQHILKGNNSDIEDDTDVIGPMPSEMLRGDASRSTAAEIESRARQMRERLEGKNNTEEKVSRESWMTELPSAELNQSLGLQARTFRAKAGPDMSDRSGWTDTPADREKKAKEEASRKRPHEDVRQSESDQQRSKEIKKYNKSNRPESLLELHQKELKKNKKKTEDKPTERRPFDRETDLQVNKFDDAQRKAIIKKSQKLDSRFSQGTAKL
ncbi:Hypothetical predicted protein [Mytilus galloprovincialis]|uniref:DUF3752 domain-containing protein n=1 Tax=Mytilus galloprovincialis TaxID=29158 RepID=A0A8B6GFI5_MYTGA|nr:Hypothetical predicted protein [Mytilus galloprovincialis]